jgi:lipopolysaccharide transport system permease protein
MINKINSNKKWDLILESGKIENNYFKDLWLYRELFYILSWRDLKVRYKQTILGATWSIIRPVLTTIIFTLIKKNILF